MAIATTVGSKFLFLVLILFLFIGVIVAFKFTEKFTNEQKRNKT